MKKYISLFFALVALLLTNCKGSESYRGNWKAMDAEGHKSEITFTENTITVKDSTGEVTTLQYTQNSIKFHNTECTFGITIKDKGTFQIYFPNKKCDSGLIRIDDNNTLYSIDRNEFLSFEDRFGRKH